MMTSSRWLILIALFVVVQSKRHDNQRLRADNQQNDDRLLAAELDEYIRELSEYSEKRKLQQQRHRSSSTCDPQSSFNLEAVEWTNGIDATLKRHQHTLSIADWNYLTDLTEENAKQLELAQTAMDDWFIEQLPIARNYLKNAESICNLTTVRMLKLFVNTNVVPIANDSAIRQRINRIVNSLEQIYSTAVVHDDVTGSDFRLDPELTNVMATSRDYKRLLWAWQAWRDATGPHMKNLYAELVSDMNTAANDNGFADVSVAWQVTDFEQANVEEMMDRLFAEIEPFYRELHGYVRRKLIDAYPDHDIDPRDPIPAHLLGDMWAQQWGNIIDLLLPYPNTPSVNVTDALLKANYTALDMFRASDDFYQSLGFEPMTDEFWSRSLLVRPNNGKQVACHGSAHDFFTDSDFRIKMCSEVNQVDFETVHHEMGHIQYFMQYRHQPTVFRGGANAAFHEAVGDTISLSVMTAKHLRAVGLIGDSAANPNQEADLNFLMKVALNKVAFLPFAYVMDKYRYRVFRGDVTVDEYNAEWWKLRERYQGLKAPVTRLPTDFDPGSKYHVPANVPYSRYFLSFLGQFQFHSTLCKLAKQTGPLHHCDIYRSSEAGNRLKSVLSVGASQPWTETMRTFTGESEFSVQAILEYLSPLRKWLQRYNRENNVHVGW